MDPTPAEQTEAFARAIRHFDLQAAAAALDAGADVNARDEFGETPLMHAVKNGHWRNRHWDDERPPHSAEYGDEETVRFLIEKGADVNAKDASGEPTLMHVPFEDADTLGLLLDAGADVNARDEHGNTVLMKALCGGDAVRLLLERGAAVNARNEAGDTALSKAVEMCHDRIMWDYAPETVRLLLEGGSDVGARNSDGRTVLDWVEREDIADILRAAQAAQEAHSLELDLPPPVATAPPRKRLGPDPEPANPAFEPAVPLADYAAAEWALFNAIERHDRAAASAALDVGITTNVWDKAGNSPLMNAVLEGDLDIARLLLDRGADPDARQCWDWHDKKTVLMLAAGAGSPEMVGLLLDRGASPDFEAGDFETALEVAAHAGSVPTARLLIERGGSDADKTLFQAAEKGATEAVRTLLDAGVDVNASFEQQENGVAEGSYSALMGAAEKGRDETVQLLIERGASLDTGDSISGETALMKAAQAGHVGAMRRLLDAGAAVDVADENGDTALTMAASCHATPVALLLDHGANPNSANEFGRTALMRAARADLRDAVSLLLERGADVNAVDQNGDTAWAYSQDHLHQRGHAKAGPLLQAALEAKNLDLGLPPAPVRPASLPEPVRGQAAPARPAPDRSRF